ncbi:CHAP domain-containing protein [bacterium]|nr:CHAP domain-containing protein [bacterium]
MNYFDNTFRPITEKTDILPVLSAYNNPPWIKTLPVNGPSYKFKPSETGNFKFSNNGFTFRNSNQNNPFILPFFHYFSNNYNSNNRTGIYTFADSDTGISRANSISYLNEINKTSKNTKQDKKDIGQSFVKNARKYIGYNEKDGSFKKFSNDTEWCADFVTYVVKESYKQRGLNPPKGFGSWRCENIKQWAIDNGKFLNTANADDKVELIKSKVKLGDLMILRENGASHIGIVSKKYKDGSFDVIEGNVPTKRATDEVVETRYYPYNTELSGFVQLS